MLQLRASSLADTHEIARAIAGQARPGDIVVLAGEMGAGKTAFAQGFAAALGVQGPVTSPTFTLVHSYDVPPGGPNRALKVIHHADLYRLDSTAEVADLALTELAEFDAAVLVEWGNVADAAFGEHLTVFLDADVDDDPSDDSSDDSSDESGDDLDEFALDGPRVIELSAVGASWAARWERLSEALGRFRC